MHRRTREVRNSETTMKVQNPNPSQEENGGGAYQGLLPVRTQATSARARTKTGGAQSKIEPPLARIRRGSGARARAPPSGRSTAARSRSGERARRRGGRRRRRRFLSDRPWRPLLLSRGRKKRRRGRNEPLGLRNRTSRVFDPPRNQGGRRISSDGQERPADERARIGPRGRAARAVSAARSSAVGPRAQAPGGRATVGRKRPRAA